MGKPGGVIAVNKDMVFQEAVDYFGERLPVTAAEFRRLEQKHKSLAFTVSGYTSLQILKRFQEKLLEAIEEGTTAQVFRESMNSFLEEQGYEGLTAFQADNVFRTNIQTAFQAGHYAQMTNPTVLRLRPYWMYDAVNDSATRPSHLAMDGRVYPADSKVWDTWYPPNGYRCRCTIRTLSRRQVEQRGLTVETEVPERAELPDGRVVILTPDTGFRSNAAKVRFTPDLTGYPEVLVKAYNARKEAAPENAP